MNVEPYCRCPGCGECDAHRRERAHDPNVPVGMLGLPPKEAKRERQRRSALALRLQRAAAEAALAEPPSGDWIVRSVSVVWYDGTGEDFDRLVDLLARVEAIAARHR